MKNCESCGANEIVAEFCAYCGTRREAPLVAGAVYQYRDPSELQALMARQAMGVQNCYSPQTAYGGLLGSSQYGSVIGGLLGNPLR